MLFPLYCRLCNWFSKAMFSCWSKIKDEAALDQTLEILNNNLAVSKYIAGSFFHAIVPRCKATNPAVQTAIMFEGVPYRLEEYLQQVNADYIVTAIETFNDYLLDVIKKQGRKLLFYTINTPAEAALAMDAAPYGIITNYPDLYVG